MRVSVPQYDSDINVNTDLAKLCSQICRAPKITTIYLRTIYKVRLLLSAFNFITSITFVLNIIEIFSQMLKPTSTVITYT